MRPSTAVVLAISLASLSPASPLAPSRAAADPLPPPPLKRPPPAPPPLPAPASPVAPPQPIILTHPGTVAPSASAKWQDALRRSTVSLATDRSFCTGTWISPHAVLTAAHCVETLKPGSFYVVPSPDAVWPAVKLETGGYVIHPTYVAARRTSGDPARNVSLVSADFAVVTVPRGIPAGARVAILDFAHSVKAGTLQYVAGFGQTGTRNGVPIGYGVLRSAPFKALYKFSNAGAPGAKDAKDPKDAKGAKNEKIAKLLQITPIAPTGTYWTLDGEDRAEACRGDSGGPAFWTSDDTMMQFGVNSYIMAATRDDLARLGRMAAQEQRGELLSLADLEFFRGLQQAAVHVQSQGCSRLVTVASIGEHRDWITTQRDQIERAATLRK